MEKLVQKCMYKYLYIYIHCNLSLSYHLVDVAINVAWRYLYSKHSFLSFEILNVDIFIYCVTCQLMTLVCFSAISTNHVYKTGYFVAWCHNTLCGTWWPPKMAFKCDYMSCDKKLSRWKVYIFNSKILNLCEDMHRFVQVQHSSYLPEL